MTRLAQLAALEGLITPAIGETLHAIAGGVSPDHAIVEIGSYKGKSTAYLAEGSRRGGRAHVYAVDPWEDLPVAEWCGWCEQPTLAAFRAQLESVGLMDLVQPIQATSAEAARHWHGPKVELLYIDGGHDYVSIFTDLVEWRPHLSEERTVVVDDYGLTVNPDVSRAVEEVVGDGLYRLDSVLHDRVAVLL